MPNTFPKFFLFTLIFLFVFTSCTIPTAPTQTPVQPASATRTQDSAVAETPVPTSEPPRVLTVCMGREPSSLFLYGDSSVAARSIREAIYDGPFDLRNFDVAPVILTEKPDLANGGALLQPVQVEPGAQIVDSQGKLGNLAPGVSYLPSGCSDASCAKTYQAGDPVTMDQLVVRFKLLPGLQWSDGAPLTSDDSLYSFEVAKSLYPRARADLLARTQSYLAPDAVTAEWSGVPGYRDPRYASNFFTPLPRHAWGELKAEDLLTAEQSSRAPLGWGPYKIDEWTAGDHISLTRNPAYFRASEGLPHYTRLVFRFMPNGDEALAALLAGECDYLDETNGLESKSEQLIQLQDSGKAAVKFETGTAWEHADFGIASLKADHLPLFQLKETRQAVAMCIDRKSMADELFFGKSQVPDTYVAPGSPLYNPDARHYDFDPQAASTMLDQAGWKDSDNNPASPRVASGVAGVPDGTPFKFTFLTTDEAEKQRAAQIIQTSLAQCGIQVDINSQPWDKLLASGPEGPVFGRNFDMAQYGWTSSLEPPCFLYTTAEIPGAMPDSPKGWGGANASGYSNPEFDQACQQALASLPDDPQHKAAHQKAQAIFAEDLPAIPLYLRLKLVVTRPDLCNVTVDPSADSALSNLEAFDSGESCAK